ncbi:glucan phosphoethanolaminetransferase (alkaline phosphatase superfamily) [Parabacteroides sp. PF5-5]|uniref:hypothetical protein n=1 Tax=unclassified Parabacteroides TaxID=2649774 RepID=UPI0024744D50|nr:MULTISPECIES: hypothetical protein [unclassified Parabacteroides]MDH6306502.1 glucan phosphoethanolaminetransferase (alkaline phosphatase superfamily) [Parabacteroides sp. PH5-39]MDH6317469.1 glucan phosphoethanolaminetransferase (alkaline phosphatase superfamily) [Parabacteroides sp. PF5-13]MDH6321228.1 glucan phosphoethanolaminetransferase (alkaline phosphatase superfamily) [Parabacteroides sp. PH5-13]MDH6324960.1 glucan phosphoethanolaminetransferase (alkaline phosphatase superfamily) [Pa
MDLDKAKKAWMNNSFQPSINKDKIEHIMNKDGQSAFIKMKRYILRGVIICLVYSLFLMIFYLLAEDIPGFLPFIVMCQLILIIGGLWSYYCYRYLQKIDLGRMDITTFSRYFLRFRSWEKWEWVAKAFFVFLIIATFVYTRYDFFVEGGLMAIICFPLLMLFSIGIGAYIYRRYYWGNIKKVEQALEEIEEN